MSIEAINSSVHATLILILSCLKKISSSCDFSEVGVEKNYRLFQLGFNLCLWVARGHAPTPKQNVFSLLLNYPSFQQQIWHPKVLRILWTRIHFTVFWRLRYSAVFKSEYKAEMQWRATLHQEPWKRIWPMGAKHANCSVVSCKYQHTI